MPVKENQKKLRYAIIDETPDESWSPEYHTTELGHGRIETRSIKIAALEPHELDFPGARSIAIIQRSFEDKKRGRRSSEQVAYISSLTQPDPETFLAVSRYHWSIENSLHYVKDFTYLEDRHTMHTANGHFNMSLLRACAISVANLVSAPSMPAACSDFKKTARSLLNSFKVNYRLAPA